VKNTLKSGQRKITEGKTGIKVRNAAFYRLEKAKKKRNLFTTVTPNLPGIGIDMKRNFL